ncbi:amidohydrolase [Actibacterium mucosum KCTC 23349]|uniref:Amidohydrolase n=1 Tax=Actibacterium mucosum KCTC 23349 TaxID=1454373 RepID=A0A037ZG89_9RHOB|nr:amidohydrolase family protein [Actibacterium mucosum]KAJ55455.1 amidohydrolase [Actibacterium mucosum KCTC 23349]
MKIDAHHHFWNPNERDYYWMGGEELASIRRPIGPDDMAPLLDKAGIGGTVLVQTIPSLDETRDFLRVAAEVPFVKGVVGWVDLTDPNVGDTIAALQAGPGGAFLKGIRHQAHDEDDKGWMARADVIEGVRACGAAGLVQDLLPKEPELPACITCVDALPDVTFVVDHIAKPRIADGAMEPWLDRITEIAKRPNVYCKLSGMVTEADWTGWSVDDLRRYADHVLALFGPDRVIFGSDWPVCLLAAEYADVVGAAESLIAGLTEDQKRAVQGGNAARVYGLDLGA